MKIVIIILGLLTAGTSSQGQSTNTNYTGKATVAGLGNIAFPPGEWSLEFQRIQHPTNVVFMPDYFVFKRIGDRLERLTFLRHQPTVTPRRLGHMLDTIGETLGDGIPSEAKKSGDEWADRIHPMSLMPASPTATERQIQYSFIYVRPSPAPAWLCHSILFFHDKSAIVIAHASTSVTDPETVEDVQFRSRLIPNTKSPRDDK